MSSSSPPRSSPPHSPLGYRTSLLMGSLTLLLSCSKPSPITHLVTAFPPLKHFSVPAQSLRYNQIPLSSWLQRAALVHPYLLCTCKPINLLPKRYGPSHTEELPASPRHIPGGPCLPSAFCTLTLSPKLNARIPPSTESFLLPHPLPTTQGRTACLPPHTPGSSDMLFPGCL